MRIIQQCCVLILLLLAAQAALAERPNSVDVKASEKDGAGVVERVQLYSKSYALVIGNRSYAHWTSLDGAETDAKSVAVELKDHGFKVELLFDLNGSELREKLRYFFAKQGSDPESRLLLWFAGHGYTSLDRQGYLVPVDAVADGESGDFRFTALPMRDFESLVRQAKAKHVLSVFDSCFSGTIFKSRSGDTVPRAITRISLKPVRQFITSGGANQKVSDDGTFRRLFIRALRGESRADFNGDGYLTGEELGLYLKQEMDTLTDGMQKPEEGKLKDDLYNQGDFVFFLSQSAEQPVLSAPPTSTAPQRTRGTSLDSLKQQQQLRDQWSAWQQQMRQSFDETLNAAKTLDQDLQYQAWNQFLANYSNDNPLSTDDESLRQQAKEHQSRLQTRAVPVMFTEVSSLLAQRAQAKAKQSGVHVAGEERTIGGMAFRWIPPGEFEMGSREGEGDSDEHPQHHVTIRKGFWMAETELTKGEFGAFVKATGYQTEAEKGDGCYGWTGSSWNKGKEFNWRHVGFEQTDDHPVVCVSWNDAQAYLKWKGGGYRLPSESEWEYAARAGSKGKYSFGDDERDLCRYGNVADQKAKEKQSNWTIANCDDGYGITTAPVGSFQPNVFGLNDVHGNVWEWVQDCYIDSYNSGPNSEAAREEGKCGYRVLRGGSWYSIPANLRSANRDGNDSDHRDGDLGFRVVLSASAVQD